MPTNRIFHKNTISRCQGNSRSGRPVVVFRAPFIPPACHQIILPSSALTRTSCCFPQSCSRPECGLGDCSNEQNSWTCSYSVAPTRIVIRQPALGTYCIARNVPFYKYAVHPRSAVTVNSIALPSIFVSSSNSSLYMRRASC